MKTDGTSNPPPALAPDPLLYGALGWFLLVALAYLLPVVDTNLVARLEYYFVWFLLLGLLVLLALTAALNADDAASRSFWGLFGLAHAIWLSNWIVGPMLADTAAWLQAFVKDLLLLAMYCTLAVAVDLKPGMLMSELQRLRAALAAISSVLLIIGIFGYFALVPALTGLAAYESPFLVYAVLDAYLALRFLLRARSATHRSWRRIMGLLALSFGLLTVGDTLIVAADAGRLPPGLVGPGLPLNLLLVVYCVPAFLATRTRPGRPQVTPRSSRGAWSDGLNLVPIMAYGIAIPLLHLGGYGLGLLAEESRQVRDLFVLGWLAAATLVLAWQYLVLRSRLQNAERERLGAEDESAGLQSRLRQAQRIELMGQLSGGLAREFGDSLIEAEACAGRLLEASRQSRAPLPDAHAKGLADALAGCRELVGKFASLSSGEEPTATVVSLVDEVRSTLDVLRPGISRDIQLDFHYDARDISAIARPHDLQQIVINLVLNARDAIGDGERGHIDVHVGYGGAEDTTCTSCGALIAGSQVWLRVSDSGPGVPAAVRHRIFEPLYSTKPAGRGSGLGLSIVHVIVHQLRGHIVLGEPRQAHCSFTVLLPAVDTDRAGSHVPAQRDRVLLVESDRVLANAVRRNPALHRLHVNHVTSAEAAGIVLGEGDDLPELVVVGNLSDPIEIVRVIDLARALPGVRTVLCCRRPLRHLLATQEGIDLVLEQPVDDAVFAGLILERDAAQRGDVRGNG